MDKAIRLLMLEDNPADAEIIQFELANAGLQFKAKVVKTERDFIEAICDFSPDVILSDYDLPNYNGAAALAEAKIRCKNVPFILVTGAISEERAIDTLTSGAKDYVMKHRLSRLVPAIHRAIAEEEERRAFRKTEKELKKAHKELEDEVKKRTAELQTLMDNAPIAIWVAHDPQCLNITGNVYANEVITKTPLGSNVSCSADPDDIKVAYRVFRNGVELSPDELPAQVAAKTGKTVSNDVLELVFSDGRRVHLLEGAVPLFDTEGVVSGAVATGVDITAIKEAQKRLIDSQEQQQQVLNMGSIGTFDINLATGEGFWNSTMYELLGLDPEQLPAGPETFFRFVHPEDLEQLRAQWSDAVQTGNLDTEFRIVRPDGEERWLAGKGHFFFESEKEKEGQTPEKKSLWFMGVNFDITERKLFEQKIQKLLVNIRDEKEKLEALINSTQDELWFTDTQKKFTLMNPAAMNEFGLKALTEIDVQKFASSLEVYRPDGSIRPIEESPPLKALGGELVKNQEEVIRTPAKKELRYRQVNSSPVKNVHGDIIGSISVVRDITEQKLLELKLKESEKKYRIVAENTYDFEFWINPQGQYVYASPSSDRITGYNAEAYINDPDLRRKIVHPDDLEIFDRHVLEEERNQKVGECAIRIIHADGSTHWISHACQPVFSETNEYLGLRGRNRDLTEYIKTQEALRAREFDYHALFENMLDGSVRCQVKFSNGKLIDFVYLEVNRVFQSVTGLKDVVGRQVTEVIPGVQESNPELFTILGKVITTGQPERFEIQIKPLGMWFFVSAYKSEVDQFVAIFENITQRKMFEEAQRHNNERLAILTQTATRLLETDQPQRVINELCTRVMTFLECDVFFNFLVADNISRLHLNAYAGIPAAEAKNIEWLDYGVAVCGCVAEAGQRIVAEHIQDMMDVRTELVRSYGIKAYACHPLMEKDRVIGTLSFGSRSKNTFSTEDLDMMKAVAAQVAIAIFRFRTESALRESENRFRAIFEQAAVGVALVHTTTGKFTRINQKYCDFVGYTMLEMLQKTFMDVTYPEDIQANEDASKQIITGEQRAISMEKRYRHKNGSMLWGKLTISPLWKPDEKPSEYFHIAIVEDITDRKRTETALRESEQLYRAIGESIDYGIWVCDPEGRNIYASDSFLRLVGLTQEQCSNLGWGDVLHPDDAEKTIASWKECVQTRNNWDIEHRFLGVDKKWHAILARGVPVRNDDGEVIYWAGINLDISKLKEVESNLNERTIQLSEANKELESFTYSISHDLRAPLRAIDGYSRMFLKKYGGILSEDALNMLDVIRSNTEMTGLLLDRLLSLSRLQQISMNYSDIDMNSLVNEVWLEMKKEIHDRDLRMEFSYLIPLIGDRLLIKQVLLNLLSNAVKFTKNRQQAIICISSYPESDKVIYCLKDNGVGFDMAYYDKLFGVFQRLHSQEEYEGTGVGLAIVQRILKRHGGQVWAEGEVDKGATFYFSLPATSR